MINDSELEFKTSFNVRIHSNLTESDRITNFFTLEIVLHFRKFSCTAHDSES